jgi:hypothetical protein
MVAITFDFNESYCGGDELAIGDEQVGLVGKLRGSSLIAGDMWPWAIRISVATTEQAPLLCTALFFLVFDHSFYITLLIVLLPILFVTFPGNFHRAWRPSRSPGVSP